MHLRIKLIKIKWHTEIIVIKKPSYFLSSNEHMDVANLNFENPTQFLIREPFLVLLQTVEFYFFKVSKDEKVRNR